MSLKGTHLFLPGLCCSVYLLPAEVFVKTPFYIAIVRVVLRARGRLPTCSAVLLRSSYASVLLFLNFNGGNHSHLVKQTYGGM